MKKVLNQNQKLDLQKKTIKKLTAVNMAQLIGGVKNNDQKSTMPVTIPPTGTN
jgi:hypothetical protein